MKMTKLKQKCIIIDIDETIAYEPFKDDLPYGAKNEREAWNEYHAKRKFYSTKIIKPIRETIELIEGYYSSSHTPPTVIFLTARENLDLIRLNTYRFIRKNFKCFNSPQDFGKKYYLLMRDKNDYRPSDIIKEQYLKDNILPYYNVVLAFDDDIRNIDMFLKNGITVIQPHSVDVYNLMNSN